MASTEKLTRQAVSAADGLDDWRVVLFTLQASFRTGSMAAGLAFAARIGEAADAANHHPDLTVTYPRVEVLLTTHDVDGLSQRDIDLARTISAIAAELGIEAEPTVVSITEIAIDTMDRTVIRPFWQAVMGHEPDGVDTDEVADPARRHPTIWFQQLDEPRPVRNRIHFDVVVPHDEADRRVAAALAAGGRLVSDGNSRAFWILADPDGNEVCICTWQDRST